MLSMEAEVVAAAVIPVVAAVAVQAVVFPAVAIQVAVFPVVAVQVVFLAAAVLPVVFPVEGRCLLPTDRVISDQMAWPAEIQLTGGQQGLTAQTAVMQAGQPLTIM